MKGRSSSEDMTFALSSSLIFVKPSPSYSRTTLISHFPCVPSSECPITELRVCSPISQIRDNIAIGDPSAAADDEHIRLAARLGGAESFIEKLPEGYNTYLDRPVRDYYAGLPEGTKTLFGRSVDYSAVRGAGGMKSSSNSSLSGGQMQRLAVYVLLDADWNSMADIRRLGRGRSCGPWCRRKRE